MEHLPKPMESAIEKAGFFSKATFTWVSPLIEKGVAGETFSDRDAAFLVRRTDDVFHLSERFHANYQRLSEKYQVCCWSNCPPGRRAVRRSDMPISTHAQACCRSNAETRSTSR